MEEQSCHRAALPAPWGQIQLLGRLGSPCTRQQIYEEVEVVPHVCSEEINPGTLLIHRQGSKKLSRAQLGSEMIFLNCLFCLLKVLCQEKRLNYKKKKPYLCFSKMSDFLKDWLI